MIRRLPLFVFILLLAVAVGALDPLSLSHTALTSTVEPGGTATFLVQLTNNQVVDGAFLVEKDQLNIFPFSDVIKDVQVTPSQVDLKPRASGTVTVAVKMFEDVKPGKSYKTTLKVRSLTNPNVKASYDLVVNVVTPKEPISVTAKLPAALVPGREFSFDVTFKNNINIIFEAVDLYVSSDLFTEQFREKLFPYQDITKTITLTLDPATKPGIYSVGARAFKDSELKGKFLGEIEVVKNPEVEERVETSAQFLTRTTTITRTNTGNVLAEEVVTLYFSTFQRLFTSFSTPPQRELDDRVEWQFEIPPGESRVVSYTTNYQQLFAALIVLLLLIAAFVYWLNQGMQIKKSVFHVRDSKGTSELKVMLHIRNRTHRHVTGVKVLDVLPNIVQPSAEFGTLEPDQVQKGDKTTRLVWEIKELEPREERILSYQVTSQLSIIGSIVLPPATVRFKGKKGEMAEVFSNRIVFGSRRE